VIRILLADDHSLVRTGIKHLLEETGCIEVVAEAANGSEAVFEFQHTRPDVVILDISMPIMDGLDACKQIKKLDPNAKILILSVHSEEQYAMRLINAGAMGYISKKVTSKELQEAIKTVAQGKIFLPPDIKDLILNQLLHPNGHLEPLEALSDRELQVFNLIAQGKKMREAADILRLSEKTIDNYRSRILVKLNLKRSVDIVAFAHEHNLV
jgi:DNA-binding NarL/FixJ family response regulator